MSFDLLKSDPFADSNSDDREDYISAGTHKSGCDMISAQLSFGD